MKANNLKGEYCQTCAAILDDVQRNHRPVIVLDTQCAAVYHQSGDAERLHQPARLEDPKPVTPVKSEEPETKHETAKVQETPKGKATKTKRR